MTDTTTGIENLLARLDFGRRAQALDLARVHSAEKGSLSGKWESDERILERAEVFLKFLTPDAPATAARDSRPD